MHKHSDVAVRKWLPTVASDVWFYWKTYCLEQMTNYQNFYLQSYTKYIGSCPDIMTVCSVCVHMCNVGDLKTVILCCLLWKKWHILISIRLTCSNKRKKLVWVPIHTIKSAHIQPLHSTGNDRSEAQGFSLKVWTRPSEVQREKWSGFWPWLQGSIREEQLISCNSQNTHAAPSR